MITDKTMIRSLGNEPPILADGRKAPDRREISLRWLSGTFLTGITSSLLMGVALFAALDGRQQLAIPAEAYGALDPSAGGSQPTAAAKRGSRILTPSIVAKPSDRTIMEVSTMTHDGEKEVVRRQPFAHVKMTLAANHQPAERYPSFDPLAIFSNEETDTAPPVSRTGTLYGSDVESEVALKTVDFPLKGSTLKFAPSMSMDEVEENVRTNGSVLTDGNTQIASLFYVDPRRFASDASDLDLLQGLSARIVEENMTVSAFENITDQSTEYADDVIPVRRATPIATVLLNAGYAKAQAEDIAGLSAARTRCEGTAGGRCPAHRHHPEGRERRGKDRPRQRLFARQPCLHHGARRQRPFREGLRAAAAGSRRHRLRRQWHAGDHRRPRPAARL